MVRHLFTPDQANRTLPLVKRVVGDLLDKGRELRDLARRPNESGSVERAPVLEREVRELLIELERIGCSYKDWGFEYGLVDFPGEIDGERVLLCWRSDEHEVSWYHLPETGFAGRRPIPERLLPPRAG
ncbi:MAG: DUF2203 domain-containing protein [Planctomycetes bacterium]|nr:DUF2203 domain-containing protein [Planctomycetota bacterium]